MPNFILNGAPFRTRPHFMQSRMNQLLPGPGYGDRKRLTDNTIQTYKPKDWQKTSAVAKIYPGLRGLGETDDLFDIMKKAKVLLQKGYESAKAERQSLNGVVSAIIANGGYDANTFASKFPSLASAIDGYGKAAAYFTQAIMKIDLMLNHQGPWSPAEADVVYQIRDTYNREVSKLSQQERQDAGLGNPVVIILIGGAAALAILLIGASVASSLSPPDPVALEERKNAAMIEIDSDPNLTPAQKAEFKKRMMDVKPPSGGFFTAIGTALAVVAVGYFVLKSGLLGAVGHRISRRPSRSAAARERYEEASYDKQFAALTTTRAPRAKKSVARKFGKKRTTKPKSKFRV